MWRFFSEIHQLHPDDSNDRSVEKFPSANHVMRPFHLSKVMDMEAVAGPLNEGIASISKISYCLMDADVDPNTDMCSNYKEIREHIEHAEQSLKQSEIMIIQKLKHLDEHMEQLTIEKEKVERQHKEKCMSMDRLHIEKTSMEESLNYSKAALKTAYRNVELTKYELKREKERVGTGAVVTGAGVAVLMIPVAGWIAGPIMMYKGVCVIDEALNAIRDAEEELKRTNSQVKENSRKVSDYQSRISNVQKDIYETNNVLYTIQKEIKEVKKQLEISGGFQEKVRRTTHLLTVLRGRVSVLETHTRSFILWKPVINMIKHVLKAAGFMAEDRLVCSEDVPDLINALRENMEGLLALCDSHNNSEHDSYY